MSATAPNRCTTTDWAGCGIRAFGVAQVAGDALPALRKQPGALAGRPLAANALKYSDEQTVVGLAAVFQAVRDFDLQDEVFTDWGVLAAPRFLGRSAIAAALSKYLRDGAPSASPFIIPHRSLHSVSGTISQVLGTHGPNFAAGGGPGNVAEGLLVALAVVAEERLPGLWLVLSAWDPEPIPDAKGQTTVPAVCHAVALALVPSATDRNGPRLRVVPGKPEPHLSGEAGPTPLTSLAAFLAAPPGPQPAWSLLLDWGNCLQVTGMKAA